MTRKIRVAISLGDINGVGPEVIIKVLSNAKILQYLTPIVYGHFKVISFYRKLIGVQGNNFHVVSIASKAQSDKINLINCWDEDVKIEPGIATETSGKCAFLSLERALNDMLAMQVDALVTAPLNKPTIQAGDIQFLGHTEYIQSKLQAKDVLMFLISETLRIGLATTHIPLHEVSKQITKEVLLSKLNIMDQSLREDFWVQKPKIAVLGLNPHAGDRGLLGGEEDHIIYPAIQEAYEKGILAFGPYPADGFFGNNTYRQFDAVLAMYHDQGLIPFKQLAFHHGVNFSAGLSMVRTSPDHGTAYDIAGKNQASETSMLEALFAAVDIVKRRRETAKLLENPLKIRKLYAEKD